MASRAFQQCYRSAGASLFHIAKDLPEIPRVSNSGL